MIVHFPVGLLTSGVIFEIYGVLRNDEVAETAGRYNIRFGFWCLFPVLLVGFLGMISLENTEEFTSFLSSHLTFALLTAGLFFSAMLVSKYLRQSWGKALYLIMFTLIPAVSTAFGFSPTARILNPKRVLKTTQ